MPSEAPLQNQLRATRTRLGLSQQDLATAAGVTRQSIGGIEAGLYAPSVSVALRLARALGCPVEELFWLEGERQTLQAIPARAARPGAASRMALAQVGGRWIAQPLAGDAAFREEMIPADGTGTPGPESAPFAVELLDDLESLGRTVALAGCTPALSLWARAAERWHPGLRVRWSFANSLQALESLLLGEVHAAGLHLDDPAAGEDNASVVRRLARERPVCLVNLGVWEEGLLVAPGNPKGLRRGADLVREDIRIVNREAGAGSRMLLEQTLREDGVPSSAVRGWERTVPGHLEVARVVAAGGADAGVSTSAVAAVYGLGFVPLRRVRYDLALLREYLDHEPVRQLLGTLDHRWVRSQLRLLAGYDTARTGELVAASGPGAGEPEAARKESQ